ncbi:hypothetical protein PYCC9005_002807 [Savitreella phatthalungensis]
MRLAALLLLSPLAVNAYIVANSYEMAVCGSLQIIPSAVGASYKPSTQAPASSPAYPANIDYPTNVGGAGHILLASPDGLTIAPAAFTTPDKKTVSINWHSVYHLTNQAWAKCQYRDVESTQQSTTNRS